MKSDLESFYKGHFFSEDKDKETKCKKATFTFFSQITLFIAPKQKEKMFAKFCWLF